MKINIVYEKNDDVDVPCWAKTEYQGHTIHALGKTWDEAKERLLSKLSTWVNADVPAPEWVEVVSRDEEMDTEFVTKDGIPWGPLESREPVRRAKVHFEGGQVVKPEDREIEAGKV